MNFLELQKEFVTEVNGSDDTKAQRVDLAPRRRL